MTSSIDFLPRADQISNIGTFTHPWTGPEYGYGLDEVSIQKMGRKKEGKGRKEGGKNSLF